MEERIDDLGSERSQEQWERSRKWGRNPMRDHAISDLRFMVASGVIIVVIIIILKDEPGDWAMWTRRIAYVAAFLNMVRALLE